MKLLVCVLAGLMWFSGENLFGQRSRRNAPQSEFPRWTNAPGFEKDVFTFVRLIYSSNYGRNWGVGDGGQRWSTDFPDADYNIAFRLQQMTSMKVNPDGRQLELGDPELFRYPFVYMAEPGSLEFSEQEVITLRRYLLNGGFLMVDDFWGEEEWENFAAEMKRVFPDREILDLPRDHEIFHCVFDLPPSLNLQVPNVRTGTRSQYTGVTWERPDAHDAHIRGIYDDKNRLCVVICHNTDNGDGWEREGESEYFFREFSEKKSYPLGINIIFYSMTH
ncbi:MAG: DUF4159 domain-containing protein [Verrucomicrobiota bacterium]